MTTEEESIAKALAHERAVLAAKAWLDNPKKVIRHFYDERLTVVAIPDEHRVEFYLYPIMGYEMNLKPGELIDDSKPEQRGALLYHREGAVSAPDNVYELKDAELHMYGTIKWDGCSDLNFTDTYHHCCSRQDVCDLGRYPALCWDLMNELCPAWDEIGEDEKPSRLGTLQEMYPHVSPLTLQTVGHLLDALSKPDNKLAAVEAVISLHDAVGLTTHKVDAVVETNNLAHWDAPNGVSLIAAVCKEPNVRIHVSVVAERI